MAVTAVEAVEQFIVDNSIRWAANVSLKKLAEALLNCHTTTNDVEYEWVKYCLPTEPSDYHRIVWRDFCEWMRKKEALDAAFKKDLGEE